MHSRHIGNNHGCSKYSKEYNTKSKEGLKISVMVLIKTYRMDSKIIL